MLGMFMFSLSPADFIQSDSFFFKTYQEYHQSAQQYQIRRFVGPDLGSNC